MSILTTYAWHHLKELEANDNIIASMVNFHTMYNVNMLGQAQRQVQVLGQLKMLGQVYNKHKC